MAFVRFRVGEHYTNRDIVDTLHCDERAFLRSAEERGIVAICLNAAENPHLPAKIRVGGGPGRARLASALLSECRHQVHKAVPLVVKDVAGDVVDVTPGAIWVHSARPVRSGAPPHSPHGSVPTTRSSASSI